MSMYGEGTARPVLDCGPGRTKQSFKDDCDINIIVEKHARTGLISHLAKGVPQFADVSELPDYQTAIQQIRDAQDYFMGLPAAVRAEFKNDAGQFIDFMSQDASEEKLEELGLIAIDKIAVNQKEEVKEEPTPAPKKEEG